jgi:hypothetical protein
MSASSSIRRQLTHRSSLQKSRRRIFPWGASQSSGERQEECEQICSGIWIHKGSARKFEDADAPHDEDAPDLFLGVIRQIDLALLLLIIVIEWTGELGEAVVFGFVLCRKTGELLVDGIEVGRAAAGESRVARRAVRVASLLWGLFQGKGVRFRLVRLRRS